MKLIADPAIEQFDILIIDDEEQLCKGLERVFRLEGWNPLCMTNAIDALAVLHTRKPRLIILDLNMPLMDGMELLHEVRVNAVFRSIPVLIYTSEMSQAKLRAAIDAGAQGYLVKGVVGWDDLLYRVWELLEGPMALRDKWPA